LQSAGLTPDKKKEAVQIFDKGIEIDNINLPTNNSWLLKKYFLEMAILTIWADKKIENTESEFLVQLCRYLDFKDEDLENSMIAIEGFVLEHWEQLGYLQNKQDFNEVSERFIKRLTKLTENNKNRIISEVRESKVLMELLRKAKAEELTEEEKHTVQQLMLVVLKTIPTFVIIALPQRYLTLPVLLKVLPSNIFSETLSN